MTQTFLTALTFYISCNVTDISDTIEDNGLIRIIFRTADEEFGCVAEAEDGFYEVEMRGEIVYRLEPELLTICNMNLLSQGATILRMINAGRRDKLYSYRTEQFLRVIEETVESFAYSKEGNAYSEEKHIFPVVISDYITPLHLN